VGDQLPDAFVSMTQFFAHCLHSTVVHGSVLPGHEVESAAVTMVAVQSSEAFGDLDTDGQADVPTAPC
jgi:hypothetical protein